VFLSQLVFLLAHLPKVECANRILSFLYAFYQGPGDRVGTS
jgi:hypothetical protein